MGRPRNCTCGECPRCKKADYMREWYQRKTTEERKAWVARRDPEAGKRSDAKRSGSPLRRASRTAASKRHKEREPEKTRARTAVSNAIRDGRLVRGPCEICGAQGEGHHDDYSKPLGVRWLCRPHHRSAHGH